jgi:Family of unknown function (DUF6492)
MDNFGIMLKSYLPDIDYSKRFIQSFKRYASDPIPLYVVVPDSDISAFEQVVGASGEVLPESLWAEHLVDYRIDGNSPGYVNQEIIKLAFAEKGLLANYLCADSEAVFIRPFTRADFMASETTPFTFVTEDHELQVDPIYFHRYGTFREQSLIRLREYLDLPPTPFATCHNMAVFSAEALASLREFMAQRELSYADLLQISPYEFSWYNFWIEKSKCIPRVTREPIFEMLHMPHHQLSYALKGTTIQDLARGYVGVVVNSGYSRDQGVLDFDTDFVDTLAQNFTYRKITTAIVEKSLQRMPRVRKIFTAKNRGHESH